MKCTTNPSGVLALLALWLLAFSLLAADPAPLPHGESLPDGAIGRLGSHRFVHGQGSRVRWLGFVDDDRRIFSQSDDGMFGIWDLASGRRVWRPVREAQGGLMRAQVSADGRVVAVAANGAKVGVMRTADPTEIRWMTGASNRSSDLALSADGTLAASCDEAGILIWDTASGTLARRLEADDACRAVALSADGRLVAGGGRSRTRLWRVADGTQIAEWPGGPYTLSFGPGAASLVVCLSTRLSATSSRDSVRVLALPSGQQQWEVGGGFNQVLFSPDGALIAAAGLEGVTVLDAANGRVRYRIRYGGNQHVWAVAFSRDGRLLASGGDDSRIRLWRAADGSELAKGFGHEGPVDCLAYSPDGRTLASGGRDRSLRLWNWRAGRELRTMPEVGQSWGVERVVFSPDGHRLAALAHVQPGDRLSLWEVASGERIPLLAGQRGQGLAFVPESRELLTGMPDGAVAVWNADTGVLLRQTGKWQGGIHDLAVLPGGREVVWMGEYQGLGIRELGTGKDLRLFAGGSHHSGGRLAVAPDGAWLAVGDRVWDAVSGGILSEVLNSGGQGATVISPDGRLLAWSGGDRIHLWERLIRQEIHTFESGAGPVYDVAFSPDGMTLASAGHEGNILLWDVTGGSRPGSAAIAQADLASLWEQLGGADHWAAHQAAGRLACVGTDGIAWLAENLQPAREPDDREVGRLRGQFQSPDFEVREQAARALLDLGLALSAAETNALRRPLPDFRSDRFQQDAAMPGRGRPVLLGPPPRLSPLPERRRSSRAIKALEYSAAPNATPLLERLAAGWPHHPQTAEAKAALARRLKQRK
jgi:WD40 repeat protein